MRRLPRCRINGYVYVMEIWYYDVFAGYHVLLHTFEMCQAETKFCAQDF